MKKSMKILLMLILVSGGLFSSGGNSTVSAAETVIINPHQQFQTIDGWGTSLAWWANIVGGWQTSTRDQLMDDLFSVNNGIGLNMVRYNIGGGINDALENNYRVGADIPSYQPTENQWDWNADYRQRWVLREAFNRDANLAEAFSNSPPYWMTYAQCASGSSNGGQNLDTQYYDAFAEYLAEVADYIESEDGITFHSLSPFNEPDSSWWTCGNNQEGSHFGPAAQEVIIDKVHNELQSRNLNIGISAPEEYSVQNTINSFDSYSSYTKSLVAQINTHAYSPNGRATLKALADNHQKDLWMSEVSIGGSVGYTPWDMAAGALNLSNQILDDMKQMQPSVWAYWQAVEDKDRAIEHDHSHGLIHAPFTGTETYDLGKQYYALGNYSKFMRPGHQVIGALDDQTLASYDASSDTLVIVTTNDTSSNREIDYDLSAFSQVSGDATPYRTSNSEDLAQLSTISASTNGFSATAAANSVTTYLIFGVVPGQPNTSDIDPNAYYQLFNENSGKVLDVTGQSTTDGAEVIQWTSSSGTNQQWQFKEVSGGYYILINRNSGKALDVFEGSSDPGASVIQWTEHGNANQQWSVIDAGGGNVYLMNRETGLVLDVDGGSTTNGANVIQWNLNQGDNQKWNVVEIP